jgi:hypothetical protein
VLYVKDIWRMRNPEGVLGIGQEPFSGLAYGVGRRKTA